MKNLKLKKSLGQHFLHDEAISQQIIDALDFNISKNILEIGPGGGALTKYLLKIKEINFIAIETDPEKVNYLLKNYPKIEGKILHEDFTKSPIPFKEDFTIIGNFPYNISSVIMFKILDWEEQVVSMVGMFQKEVAQRIASKEGKKSYGILSVLIQAFYNVDYLFDVPPESFSPPPKVMSGVIKLTHSGNPFEIKDKKEFIRFVKLAFSQRRKTLRNVMKSYYDPELLKSDFFNQRAEQLSVSEFVEFYKEFKQYKND